MHAALGHVLDRIPLNLPYRLVGTAAALVHGVPIRARDIDILVATRADVDRIAGRLGDRRCIDPPAWLVDSRQYFARFIVAGIEVEISTAEATDRGLSECTGIGPWTYFRTVPVGDHLVPAVALELRLVSELVRGRPERAAPIIDYLKTHGCDHVLLERSMADRGISESARRAVRAGIAASNTDAPP